MSYRTIVDAIAAQIAALTPTTWPTVPYVVRDRGAGPVTPLADDVARGRSRVVELARVAGPADDGAAGISDRHVVDIELRLSYTHLARQRWTDQIVVEDAETIQGAMRDPSWWVSGTYSIETLAPAETDDLENGAGALVGMLLSIPLRLRYV